MKVRVYPKVRYIDSRDLVFVPRPKSKKFLSALKNLEETKPENPWKKDTNCKHCGGVLQEYQEYFASKKHKEYENKSAEWNKKMGELLKAHGQIRDRDSFCDVTIESFLLSRIGQITTSELVFKDGYWEGEWDEYQSDYGYYVDYQVFDNGAWKSRLN